MRVFALLIMLAGHLPARQVPITILHTAELQGELFARADAPDEPQVGGLLLAASYIDEVREAQRNVLLFDSGDCLGGAPESDGETALMARAMNHMGYDALAVGDQDLGRYTERFEALEAPLLAANVKGLPSVKPHVVLQVDGVRIVVLGWTMSHFHQHFLGGAARVEAGLKAMDGMLAEIKQLQPDVICLLAHLGAGDGPGGELKTILRRYPELDVVIGGHTGQSVPEIFFGETLFSQAGSRGLRVGRVDLIWDTVQRRLIKRTARLWKIGNRYVESPPLRKALEPEIRTMRASLEQPFAEITGRFARRVGGDLSGAERLVGRALCATVPAEIAWWPRGLVRVQVGTMTAQSLAAAVPRDEGLMSVQLTVAEMREMLMDLQDQEMPLVWGMQWSESATGELRITDQAGASMHARKRFTLVLPESLAASDGGRFPVLRKVVHQPVARLTRGDHSLRSALRAYLEKHSPIDGTDE